MIEVTASNIISAAMKSTGNDTKKKLSVVSRFVVIRGIKFWELDLSNRIIKEKITAAEFYDNEEDFFWDNKTKHVTGCTSITVNTFIVDAYNAELPSISVEEKDDVIFVIRAKEYGAVTTYYGASMQYSAVCFLSDDDSKEDERYVFQRKIGDDDRKFYLRKRGTNYVLEAINWGAGPCEFSVDHMPVTYRWETYTATVGKGMKERSLESMKMWKIEKEKEVEYPMSDNEYQRVNKMVREESYEDLDM